MAGGTVPRVDKILMIKEEINDEVNVLYSDNAYMEDNFWRFVIASTYANRAMASRVELGESSYEEVDCPKERCYMYGRQELYSYGFTLFPYSVVFYSSHTIERRIPRKTTKLSIGNKLTFAAHFAIDPLHLEFQHQDGSYIERTYKTKYMSTTVFYVLV